MDSLLNLSFEIQLILVSGYLGYWISTIGIGYKSKTTDVVMQILVFAVFAKLGLLIYQYILSVFGKTYYLGNFASKGDAQLNIWSLFIFVGAIFIAILTSCIFAMVWRWRVRSYIEEIMRTLKVHSYIHKPTSLSGMKESFSKNQIDYLSVVLKDGSFYKSRTRELPITNKMRSGLIDADGGVAMYVTKKISADKTIVKNYKLDANVMTYFAASEIQQIHVKWTEE